MGAAKNWAARWANAAPPPWIVEQQRREEGVQKLCRVLHTTKRFICDPFLSIALHEPSVDPTLLEQWLVKHGKIRLDEESIREALVRNYGEEIAALAESLI